MILAFACTSRRSLPIPPLQAEVAATCTLINFTSTEIGLEDQLLARVVNAEKPELEEEKQKLIDAFNRYKIELLELENNLLERLANAPDDILSDIPLIEGLEATKAAATEIAKAVTKAKETEKNINIAREKFRPVASQASMMYFMLTELCNINFMYQYSLDSYVYFFYKSIERAEKSDDAAQRLQNLIVSLRYTISLWVMRRPV